MSGIRMFRIRLRNKAGRAPKFRDYVGLSKLIEFGPDTYLRYNYIGTAELWEHINGDWVLLEKKNYPQDFEYEFNVGDMVTYTPFKGAPLSQCQRGKIKSVNEYSYSHMFVVFNCNNDWDNYQDYTGQNTPISKLKKGYAIEV